MDLSTISNDDLVRELESRNLIVTAEKKPNALLNLFDLTAEDIENAIAEIKSGTHSANAKFEISIPGNGFRVTPLIITF